MKKTHKFSADHESRMWDEYGKISGKIYSLGTN